MNTRYLKTMAVALVLLFLSSCAVLVRDDGREYRHYRYQRHYDDRDRHYHRRDRDWHSSLQQSNQSTAQMTSPYSGIPGALDR